VEREEQREDVEYPAERGGADGEREAAAVREQRLDALEEAVEDAADLGPREAVVQPGNDAPERPAQERRQPQQNVDDAAPAAGDGDEQADREYEHRGERHQHDQQVLGLSAGSGDADDARCRDDGRRHHGEELPARRRGDPGANGHVVVVADAVRDERAAADGARGDDAPDERRRCSQVRRASDAPGPGPGGRGRPGAPRR